MVACYRTVGIVWKGGHECVSVGGDANGLKSASGTRYGAELTSNFG